MIHDVITQLQAIHFNNRKKHSVSLTISVSVINRFAAAWKTPLMSQEFIIQLYFG